MLEVQRSPQGIISPCGAACGEDSAEEELSVLPRHTKVIVTGNNRTKSVLVGLHGVVKKAVGLGGWHWLVLTNGLEVKLQRNALSVIEAPTGQEEEDDSEDLFSNKSNVEDFPKPFKSRVRPQQKPTAVSKTANRSQAADMRLAGSKPVPTGVLKVDFSKLETTALLRYWKHFNLVELGPNPSKEQLVDAVERHFISQVPRHEILKGTFADILFNYRNLQLDELQVIASFVQAAKRLKTIYG